MELDKLNIFIGYDSSEIVAFHTCCQSILENSSIPVSANITFRNAEQNIINLEKTNSWISIVLKFRDFKDVNLI